jgi:hypothetical protein
MCASVVLRAQVIDLAMEDKKDKLFDMLKKINVYDKLKSEDRDLVGKPLMKRVMQVRRNSSSSQRGGVSQQQQLLQFDVMHGSQLAGSTAAVGGVGSCGRVCCGCATTAGLEAWPKVSAESSCILQGMERY